MLTKNSKKLIYVHILSIYEPEIEQSEGIFMELTKTDVKVISILQENSRLSFRQIAKRASISTATVMKHVQQLEKEGIIKRYAAILDYDKLGYDVSVIVDVRISKGKLFLVEKKISSHPNVTAVYDNTGQFDVTVVAKFKSRALMDKFLKLVQSYEFVERTETKLILHTMKEEELRI